MASIIGKNKGNRGRCFGGIWLSLILLALAVVLQLLGALPSLRSNSDLGLLQVTFESNSYCSEMGEKIYIDAGARDGDTLDVLRRMRPDSQSYKSYAWECNPKNVVGLKAWVEKYPEMDVTILENAAWIEDTTLKFHSTAPNSGQVLSKDKDAIDVKALDLAKWIMSTFRKSDFIFLKMDIEAAEYYVLPHIFETGAIDYIDELQIEWHDWRKWKTKERTEKRQELEALLRENNLIYKFATLDMFKSPAKDPKKRTNWAAVPKYTNSTEHPVPWVDSHYFRQAEGCQSPWDI